MIQLNFVRELDFHIKKIDFCIKKIIGSRLASFGIVIALFLLDDKDKMSQFFEKTFLLAYMSIDVFLKC